MHTLSQQINVIKGNEIFTKFQSFKVYSKQTRTSYNPRGVKSMAAVHDYNQQSSNNNLNYVQSLFNLILT